MCLDVISFSKDNMNARKDLGALCDRPLLEVKINAKGNLTRPRVLYYFEADRKKRDTQVAKEIEVSRPLCG
jgi:predicted DNA-binding protein with PD1-like motif